MPQVFSYPYISWLGIFDTSPHNTRIFKALNKP
jgi:hypothetical protein